MTTRAPLGSRWLLPAIALGVFVAAVDQTAIVTVLPAVISDIGLPVRDFYRSSWIVNAYLLGYLVALPIVGRVADVHGHARVFAAALALFVLGSAVVALAPTFEVIVAARALQAAGGGGLVPVAMAMAVAGVEARGRATRLGMIAAAAEAGALLGPLWGGVIAEVAGWRWVFWVNLPLAAPIALVVWQARAAAAGRGRIDWGGAVTLGIALAVLTYALVDDPNAPRPLLATVAMLVLVVAILAGLVVHERRDARGGGSPMLPLGMFRDRAIVAANVANVLLGSGLIAALVGVPLFVNLILGGSALDGGLTLMRLTVAVPLGALVGGWLGERAGLRGTAVAGMLLAAAGLAALRAWDRDLSEVVRTVPQLVAGLGFGLVIAPLGAAVLQRVSAEARATASAWLTLSRIAGMLIGAALLTSTGLGRFYARASTLDFRSPEFAVLVQQAQVATFHEVFVAAALIMLLAALVALCVGGGRRDRDVEWWTIA